MSQTPCFLVVFLSDVIKLVVVCTIILLKGVNNSDYVLKTIVSKIPLSLFKATPQSRESTCKSSASEVSSDIM